MTVHTAKANLSELLLRFLPLGPVTGEKVWSARLYFASVFVDADLKKTIVPLSSVTTHLHILQRLAYRADARHCCLLVGSGKNLRLTHAVAFDDRLADSATKSLQYSQRLCLLFQEFLMKSIGHWCVAT